MAEVSMDYAVVESMAEGFRGAADTLNTVNSALETAAAILRASAFVGMVGNLALAQYLENIQPNVARLAVTCDELNSDLLGAVASLRDGDLSGSLRFVDGGGSGMSGAKMAPGQPATGGGGKAVNYLSMYKDGVNGWQMIPMDGNFTPGELLTQKGPSCTIYGAMNLLVENGYDISQADADAIYQDHINKPRSMDILYDMLDGKHDEEGFPNEDAFEILDKYGADYDSGDFSTYWGLGSPDRDAAEKFLVKQLNEGNPVYVGTEINEAFGMGSGAHAYTVIGAQTDSNGKLTNVLVSTNWGQVGSSGPVWEIPARDFMDDWMEYEDGEYIVLKK
jgi:hypothetical protein